MFELDVCDFRLKNLPGDVLYVLDVDVEEVRVNSLNNSLFCHFKCNIENVLPLERTEATIEHMNKTFADAKYCARATLRVLLGNPTFSYLCQDTQRLKEILFLEMIKS